MEPFNLNQVDALIEQFCTEDWKLLINERTTEQTYKAKATIFREGEKMENMSIVKNGKVKIFSTYAKNTERIYRFATDGQILGHRGLGGDYTFPVTAVALTDTKVNIIPLSLFQSLLRANHLFSYHFMLFFAEELRQSEKQIKNLNNMSLYQRIAKALKMNAEAFGFDTKDKKKLAYTLSRKDISNLAGTTYESVIRSLSDLEKDKCIELIGKEIRILNYKKLLVIIAKTEKK